jgi:hypothetical protein
MAWTLLAHCPLCERRMVTITALSGAKLSLTLETGSDVEVFCFLFEHRWMLSEQDKADLHKVRKELTERVGR